MSTKAAKASVNFKKNRLTITFAETISKRSLDSLYTEIRFCVADLKPGFDVITDLSMCTLAALSGLGTFRKITNHLIANKVGRVVRVIDETKIIKKQLLNVAARSQCYRADIFNSIEAAEEYLALSADSSGLYFQLHEQSIDYVFNEMRGTGVVEFLSITECIVQVVSLPLKQGAKIELSIKFDKQEGLLEQMEVAAEVVRVEGNSFTAQYRDVDEVLKGQIWDRLVHQSQCELT
ncbi:MAG: hypothetical protein COA36_17235 [Desulfotalea sp.]|nr:MAG: hypothetical protein COA36_17235 [Desulfotalea sp.]